MTTQAQITERFETEIPADLREMFPNLSYGEMATQPECAEYADLLLELENDWFEAEDA